MHSTVDPARPARTQLVCNVKILRALLAELHDGQQTVFLQQALSVLKNDQELFSCTCAHASTGQITSHHLNSSLPCWPASGFKQGVKISNSVQQPNKSLIQTSNVMLMYFP
jgi:hypothetical protein